MSAGQKGIKWGKKIVPADFESAALEIDGKVKTT